MIKDLMHDPIFLAGKSEVATKEMGLEIPFCIWIIRGGLPHRHMEQRIRFPRNGASLESEQMKSLRNTQDDLIVVRDR